jgi:hypothetical protein
VARHVDPAAAEHDSFGAQPAALAAGAVAGAHGDPPAGTHDAVPRDACGLFAGEHAQRPADGARPAREPGECRHQAVGCDAAARDRPHRVVDPLEEAARDEQASRQGLLRSGLR